IAPSSSVGEYRYRPPAFGLEPGGQDKIEVDVTHCLHYRSARKGGDRRDVFAWMHLVIRRDVLAERDLPDRTREAAQQCQVERHGSEVRRVSSGLLTPSDAGHDVQRKHGPSPVWAQVEIDRIRGGVFDLVPDLLQDGGRAYRGEDAGGRDIAL